MRKSQQDALSRGIAAKRRAIARTRTAMRFRRGAWFALLAETFLLALWPAGATIALLIGIVMLLGRAKTDAAFHFRHLPLDLPIGLFVLLSALSILVSPDRGFSFYNWYNLVGVYALTYFLAGQTIREEKQLQAVFAALGAAAVLVVAYGFYQYVFGIDISSMKWVDGNAFPELRKRVFSTWENPNILAGYLDVMLALAFGLFLKARQKEKRIVLGACLLLLAACLAMTYARGALLVAAVIFAGYGLLKDWRILVACIAVAALAFAVDPLLYERVTSVFTKIDTSSEMRLAFWEATVAMIQDHPFLGIGWGAYWMVYPSYDFYLQGAPIKIVHAHNFYLNYMAEIGIPGALAFFGYFFGSMWLALRKRLHVALPLRKPQPYDLAEDGVDGALKSVQETLTAPKEASRFHFDWSRIRRWDREEIVNGGMLGLGLAFVSIALNGLTDDLLFNIPSSMLLWLMAAMIGAAARGIDSSAQHGADREKEEVLHDREEGEKTSDDLQGDD